MHISLDGFVAGPNGEMDWIKVDEEIFDYVGKRISEGDTALYGRVTYQMMENYWPTAGDKLTNTTIISDNLSDSINEIKQQAGADILLFGSPTATHSLIQLNLIDGYWLFVNPIILGRGIPLFVDIKDKIKLNLLTTQQFTCGVTELNYTVDGQ